MEEGGWDTQGSVGYKVPWRGSRCRFVKLEKGKTDKGNPSRCHIPIVTHDVTASGQADLGYILHHSTGHKHGPRPATIMGDERIHYEAST